MRPLRDLASVCRWPDTWKDLGVELLRQHLVQLVQRFCAANTQKVVSVTLDDVAVLLVHERHRHNHHRVAA